MPYRLLLVEDHRILREGIRSLLERQTEFTVVAEAETGRQALEKCKELHPDVALVDFGITDGLDGVETARQILRHCPGVRVAILSAFEDEATVVSTVQAGVHAYIVKQAPFAELVEALRFAARGRSYVSPSASHRLIDRIGRTSVRHPMTSRLTPRERQVFRLIVDGKSNKEIAALLGLGVDTVRGYRKSLMKKLNVSNVAGLIRAALAAGIIENSRASGQ
ncbi:MAG TPA: response regulator transcription factor [Bryobacteraceae bacterium]|nr:response regulator transcription factor [Bryobacteraceae bacterium]